jgi:hypothetical protein
MNFFRFFLSLCLAFISPQAENSRAREFYINQLFCQAAKFFLTIMLEKTKSLEKVFCRSNLFTFIG